MIGTLRAKGVRRLARTYLSLKGIPPFMGNIGMLRDRLNSLSEKNTESESYQLNQTGRDPKKVMLEQFAFFQDLAYSNKYGENYSALKDDVTREAELNLIPASEQLIYKLDAEELISFLEVTRNLNKPDSFMNFVCTRFCRLAQNHLDEKDPGFHALNNQTVVTSRVLETHSFSRLVHLIMFSKEKLSEENLAKLKPLIDTYLYRETNNISLEDHMLVLSSLLNYYEPYDAHSEFLQNKLPICKISNCSTFVLMVDLLINLSFLAPPGKLLNDEHAFRSVVTFLESQVPYICDWPSPELSSYVVAAAVSLSKSKFKVTEPIWDVIQEGFFYFSNSFSVKQKSLYLQAALDSGLLIGSNPTFEDLINPIQAEVLSDIRPEKLEDIVGFLSIVKRTNPKSSEAIIVKTLGQLDAQLSPDFTSNLTKSTARKLLFLIEDGKHYRNLSKKRIQPLAVDN